MCTGQVAPRTNGVSHSDYRFLPLPTAGWQCRRLLRCVGLGGSRWLQHAPSLTKSQCPPTPTPPHPHHPNRCPLANTLPRGLAPRFTADAEVTSSFYCKGWKRNSPE